MHHRLSRRQLVGAAALVPAATMALPAIGRRQVGAAQATPVAAQATPVPSGTGEWPLYGYDLHGSKASTAAGLDAQTAGSLSLLWEFPVDGPVSATPVIANGVVYAGSYDGNLYAIDLYSGASVWTYATGAAVPEPNLGIDLGISGSAAVSDEVVYVGDAAAVVHAIDAATGTVIWTATVDTQPNASIWSSPVVWDGRVYVGVASIAKEVGFRGSVVALDAATGETVWQTYMVPEGADGAGVFAVPAIDTDRGFLYVGTQNAYSPNPAPYGNPISIVALDAATGETAWVFNAPPGGEETAPVDDVGFSASPNLFTATIGGEERDLVGEGQKSGEYWALDRDTGEVVWQATISPPGFLGGMEGTSAVADGIIAVPATDWPEFDGPATGMLTALDAATGETLWSVAHEAPTASPAAISGDVVVQSGMDGILHVYGIEDGAELFGADLGASVSGGIAVADGVVVLGAATPEFAPFVKPGASIVAFAVGGGGSLGTPEAATPQPA